ncbi:MAG: hypothetical protein QOG15_3660 [Solirubrobacteraceae bacterium]|nr:hypothetical protein [Solirubrobacteraceae bacterium]
MYRRRRAVALGGLTGVLVLAVLGVRACGSDAPGAEKGSAGDAAPRALTLPGGGRRIFPARRVVAFYGAPQSDALGALGIGTPAHAAARLTRVARRYATQQRPALPAFELITTIAAGGPGDDGLYRNHQPAATIDRYLKAARKAKALLLLDIQPGRGDFMSEALRLERWLREPDVGIALDPEWHVAATEVPGQTIGSVTADEINRVSNYVAGFVAERHLPEKLFVVHQFTSAMIENKDAVLDRPGLAITMNVDGFGDRANKRAKYVQFTGEVPRFHDGFKLFFEEDTNLMTPREVLRLEPSPDLVVYE